MDAFDVFQGRISFKDYFWSLIDIKSPNECWPWKGKKLSMAGYGHFLFGEKMYRAHRIALVLSGTSIPSGKIVMHTCDNRICCNPAHLVVGTQKENMDDMRNKGRGCDPPRRVGEASGTSVLNEEQVRYIRNSPLSGQELSSRFNVSKSCISEVKSRKTWRHI